MKTMPITRGLLIAGILISSQVIAADYKIDTQGQHASVTFRVSHLGFSYIVGGFNEFAGTFSHDPANPDAAKANVTIDAKSVDTNHAERDKHLRSPDFFDVGKYPKITFESIGYIAASGGDRLKGKLAFHGVSREVEIEVSQIGEGKDPWGGYRSGFQGRLTLNAADFGMPNWVGDVDIELNIEGVRI